MSVRRPAAFSARVVVASYGGSHKSCCAPPPLRVMGDAEAPPLLAAQALLLSERGRDLIVFNPGARCAALPRCVAAALR